MTGMFAAAQAEQSTASVDVALCFVPQWTPYQPPLSLPSLAAWIRRAGFSAEIVDANIGFYDFLLSERCASILLSQDLPEPRNRTGRRKRKAAREAIASFRSYRKDVDDLLKWRTASHETCKTMRASVLSDTARAIRSLEAYLDHVSALSPRFSVTPNNFNTPLGSASAAEIQSYVENPPEVLETYATQLGDQLLRTRPRMVGLSCIGFSQLVLTLIICRAIRRRSDVPIIVGGSIFPRIIERGAMPSVWFDKYLDVVVLNEGEKPLEALLRAEALEPDCLRQIPGIAFSEGGAIVTTGAAPLLKPAEVPSPDFSDMPLGSYYTSRLTFPIIASRGCYWGKCEFCHVAVDKYSGYKSNDVIATIQLLREKHGANLFFFHDYAIPPSVFRRLGRELPHDESIFMAGLFKFEKYFEPEDFTRAHAAGFRLLQVGLESASERVLALMKKNSSREIMLDNLGNGTAAGIWMHTFILFGFPGEQSEEAQETIDFIFDQRDIVGSFQAGRFELEHNAPIMRHPNEHGVIPLPRGKDDVNIYYQHDVNGGVGPHESMQFLMQLYERGVRDRKFKSILWLPQQVLFVLLSLYSPEDLVDACADLVERWSGHAASQQMAYALNA